MLLIILILNCAVGILTGIASAYGLPYWLKGEKDKSEEGHSENSSDRRSAESNGFLNQSYDHGRNYDGGFGTRLDNLEEADDKGNIR